MPDLNSLLKLLTEFAWLGNWLFFLLAFIESAPFIGVFVPGATLISIGGFLAAQGYLNTWDIIIFATLGAIFGDFFSYSLGRWGGNWIKNNKIINSNILKHGEDFFHRYGNKSVFLGRFFGPIRAIIPFIAGLSRMKRQPFIFWNIISAFMWAMLNVFLGYFSGSLIESILNKWKGDLSIILLIVIALIAIYFVVKKHGRSIKASFIITSLNFAMRLHDYAWFKKLKSHYPVVNDFFMEVNRAEEKLFGSVLAFALLIFVYLIIIILDVF